MNAKLLILGVVGLGVVYYLIVKKTAAPSVAANPPLYSNTGGGTQSTLAWLGLANSLVGAYDPSAVSVDRNTPPYSASIIGNPVSASPAVLPYSYKQATVDVPGLLGTDGLFTPGAGSGGAYTESGDPGTAAGPTANSYWA